MCGISSKVGSFALQPHFSSSSLSSSTSNSSNLNPYSSYGIVISLGLLCINSYLMTGAGGTSNSSSFISGYSNTKSLKISSSSSVKGGWINGLS